MTNYKYYTEKYLSGRESVLPESSFAFWERKASQLIRKQTFGNIDESTEIPEKVQLCVCEVAERLYQQEQEDTVISSEKVGDYSVTYRNQSREEKQKVISGIVREWLLDTGLMYCGVM